MLDADTKRKIDTARDILVGKVPDPKTQVEQITFALIYKFMDNMDQQSVGLGGKPSFFTNGYEQYAWSRLMDRRMSGADRLDLYVRALEQMSQNPYIPQLFRDIFKGAFLPYRDSETLNLFLKELDGFRYDHSEDLGDAYEYLLNILGTQGKAGQFRTPRHIIDFIVRCVDPDKNETVLDPACGTAGFLISAFKHIEEKYREHPLSPDEKKRLTQNFTGYDIAPDMVRLSRVNMYLHQFPNPTIHEYDTLTTEDRWDDSFDVILANPPFMTPKGGIRPHNRFAVRANRSEVLFVDYIAEHLNPGGRAGIIVPEGIIFQSSNAYKALRKMLVEGGYLYAVVSLPAGVFNPYSGVKTSILLLDKSLARRADSVLFVKVSADGFDLGAQRREIERNDLPEALALVKAFQADPQAELASPALAQRVSKARLAESEDYNLSAERYSNHEFYKSKFPYVPLSEIAEVTAGNSAPQDPKYYANGQKPFVRMSDVGKVHRSSCFVGPENYVNIDAISELSLRVFAKDTILFPKSGASTFLNHRVILGEDACVTSHLACIVCDKKYSNPKFVYYQLCQIDSRSITPDQAYPSLRLSEIGRIKIPLPPLEVQQEIVAEIEGYQKVIDGARQVVENYKPVIPIDPSWPLVKLGEMCIIERGASPRPINSYVTSDSNGANWVKIGDAKEGVKLITHTSEKITQEGAKKSRPVKPGDFILSNSMSFGHPYIMAIEGFIHDGWLLLRDFSERLDKDFLYFILSSDNVKIQFTKAATGGVVNNLNSGIVRNVEIPLPPINIQISISKELNQEQTFVDVNKSLIERFEAKIAACIQRVWEQA